MMKLVRTIGAIFIIIAVISGIYTVITSAINGLACLALFFGCLGGYLLVASPEDLEKWLIK